MEEEGCRPTLITYNVILNVYGKMGMPWNKIRALVESEVFQEMKLAGFVPDKVTYNALLDVYGKSRQTKEAMEVLKDMEFDGFSPSIVSYNSLISAYARDGLLERQQP
ncbi:pentatricopeptide repeat-containing protein [Prunus yedoensis var. nudiflora]|uniref:Pentatricopeptide repeat-containing protein n=1 Tax=Prunus yedoensis var. nudiflora TaxID=2094558 RepID=A0A314YFW1_PRUYE|nr:pentatricopeptide repeat-containing protein [Prunus yedoensis var. nudiflora]